VRTQYDCYAGWGFNENPFQPSPLHPDKKGERLLVGRDRELNLVKTRLHMHGKITCVEGPVGIGKTSLVNIAAFQCFHAYLENKSSQLLIPCNEIFQLSSKEDIGEFSTRVFYKIAQTLIAKASEVNGLGIALEKGDAVDNWLNNPKITQIQLGISAYVGMNRSTQMNNSSGFNAAGFEQLVRDWLLEIFPAHGSGGVVCIIDNLELLETGSKAKKLLEALRDRLFNTQGLRWVFCGANGIVTSIIASPRLSGYLTRPILELDGNPPFFH
jgi:hypothetical protein